MSLRTISFLIISSLVCALRTPCQAYLFGFKSADNTIEDIQAIEQKYDIHLPIVGFIFDDRTADQRYVVEHLNEKLGRDRIYHITLSPRQMTAGEVAEGVFDDEYRAFFRTIKEQNILVIFRTMHEMNGGWYPRGSNPDTFINAWRHVWKLAKEEGLNTRNILFSRSVNHRDAPVAPGHETAKLAKLVFCTPAMRKKTGCFGSEDYRPGSKYVDLVGFTFYNRGKASYNRGRLSPNQILNNPSWRTLERLQALGKPLFVDEVATTAVWYEEKYSQKQSQQIYATDYVMKNDWLKQLAALFSDTHSIVGALYFNCDFTNGLQDFSHGEADRAAISLANNKIYYGIYDLLNAGASIQSSKLLSMFGRTAVKTDVGSLFVYKEDKKRLMMMGSYLKKNHTDLSGSVAFLSGLQQTMSGSVEGLRRLEYLEELLPKKERSEKKKR